MRRLTVLSLLFAFVIAGVARADGEEKKIKWVTDFAAGLKAAQEAKIPVFIDFTAEW